MKKTPSLFQREDAPRGRQSLVVDRVNPGCEWALRRDEPWIATVKWDGTCVLIQEGKVFARYDAKAGKTPPDGAIPCQPAPDRESGHWPHWVLATRPVDAWIRAALQVTDAFNLAELNCLSRELPHNAARIAELEDLYNRNGHVMLDGTYEAVGPGINGNNERLDGHRLVRHGETGHSQQDMPALTFEGIRAFLAERDREGLVWHHEDGRTCKIKRKDFGLPWPMHPARVYEAFGGRWMCEVCGGKHDQRHALCPYPYFLPAKDEQGRPKAGPGIRVDSTEIASDADVMSSYVRARLSSCMYTGPHAPHGDCGGLTNIVIA